MKRWKWDKKYILEAAATIFSMMAQGMSDSDITYEMGISVEELTKLRAHMFELKSEELRQKPIEHTYVEYMLLQLRNVHDLTEMIGEFKVSKQYNAMVGAIRTRAEIYDKIMSKGQECGVVKKVAERREIIGGVVIGELSNEALKKAIVAELSGLKKLSKKYGDKDFTDVTLPEDLYLGEPHDPNAEVDESETDVKRVAMPEPARLPMKEPIEKKTKQSNPRSNKAKTNKVAGGRVQMRKPGLAQKLGE